MDRDYGIMKQVSEAGKLVNGWREKRNYDVFRWLEKLDCSTRAHTHGYSDRRNAVSSHSTRLLAISLPCARGSWQLMTTMIGRSGQTSRLAVRQLVACCSLGVVPSEPSDVGRGDDITPRVSLAG